MAGHIQDRWYRDKLDDNGDPVLDAKGKPVKERTDLHGKGLRYKVRYYDPDGNERSKSFPDRQRRRAETFLTKQQHDVLSGTYLDPDAASVKFRVYAATVMMGWSRDPSTVANRDSRLKKHVFPYLGDKSLSVFSTDTIRKWLDWMNSQGRPVAESYQYELFNLVSSILDAAVSDRRIDCNPCKDKSISRPAAGPHRVSPWPESRMCAVELALPARYKIVVPMGAGLGLRQGEMFAFSMDNIDRKKMVYRCTRQMVTVRAKRSFKLPKGHKTREIPLGGGVLDAVYAYAEMFPPVAITLPWAERDGRESETINVLMTNAAGDLYTREAFNAAVWRPTFGQAGLTFATDRSDGMHALRHLYASHMLAQGVSIKELAAFLGHADEAFTLRTYVHMMPNSYDRARLAVDVMFKPSSRRQAAG
jgi:integrase